MNRVESEKRTLHYLAIIQQRLRLATAHGLYEPIYSETVVLDSMNAAAKLGWRNLNLDEPNFPAIDLRTADRKKGIQATRKSTATKYKHTVSAMKAEMQRKNNRLEGLEEVQVVGVESVTNPKLQEWHVPPGVPGVRMRIIALDRLLRLKEAKVKRLLKIETALHHLSTIVGPQLRSDAEEMITIAAFVDRPAIRDTRFTESRWDEMDDAMKDIRRLLSLGTNPSGHTISRGWQTFQPPSSVALKAVYDATRNISRLLREEVRSPGALTPAQARLIDGFRLTIQEQITRACRDIGVASPVW